MAPPFPDTQKTLVLARVLEAWAKSTTVNLGEFLYEACGGGPDRLDNEQLCTLLERYIIIEDDRDTEPDPGVQRGSKPPKR